MEQNTEKEISELLALDIVQEYFRSKDWPNIILLYNGKLEHVDLISSAIETKAGKLEKKVQIIDAEQEIPQVEKGSILIIKDPKSLIGNNGRLKQKPYLVNIESMLTYSRMAHQRHAGYRRPS